MAIYALPEEPVFPPADEAEPDGLIAIGGDLTVERLIQAYSQGIFPWFSEDDEVFWFSPDPRLVLFPECFKIPDSLRRIIKSKRFEIRFDTVFDEVILECAAADRPDQDGTWISGDFVIAYSELHKAGLAHSVEVFEENKLAGGLYGVSLGAAFFGESMFFKVNNASKIALYALVEQCKNFGFHFIDCQVESPHLAALGATPIPRQEYLMRLGKALNFPTRKGSWSITH